MYRFQTQYSTKPDNDNPLMSHPINGAASRIAESVLLLEYGQRALSNRNHAARLERIADGLRSIGAALERLGRIENGVRP
jgi:hypothetical protein